MGYRNYLIFNSLKDFFSKVTNFVNTKNESKDDYSFNSYINSNSMSLAVFSAFLFENMNLMEYDRLYLSNTMMEHMDELTKIIEKMKTSGEQINTEETSKLLQNFFLNKEFDLKLSNGECEKLN